MLGDNAEKSKNPLKKAMKRRNAKTVQFAAPTYVEPSDVDYSSEEEGGDQPLYADQVDSQTQQQQQQQQQENQNQQIASAVVEPLKIKTSSKSNSSIGQQNDSTDDLTPSPEKAKAVDDLMTDKQGNSSKSLSPESTICLREIRRLLSPITEWSPSKYGLVLQG